MATQAEIAVLRGTATQVKNESQVGGNTAGRVGGLFEGIVDALPSDEVIDGKISEAVADIQPIVIEGNVENAPDQEDLTSVNQGGTDVLKFKDKTYAPALFSGLGRVYLRKNVVTPENLGYAINLLTAEMVSQPNTIYHIQYDYDLNGQTITLPAGCVLEFDGGSLSNGTINANGCEINGNAHIYADIQNVGNETILLSWFLGKDSDDTAFARAISAMYNSASEQKILDGCNRLVELSNTINFGNGKGIVLRNLVVNFTASQNGQSMFLFNETTRYGGNFKSIENSTFTQTNSTTYKDVHCIHLRMYSNTTMSRISNVRVKDFSGYMFVCESYLQEMDFFMFKGENVGGFISFNKEYGTANQFGNYGEGSSNIVSIRQSGIDNSVNANSTITDIIDLTKAIKVSLDNVCVQGANAGDRIFNAVNISKYSDSQHTQIEFLNCWAEFPSHGSTPSQNGISMGDGVHVKMNNFAFYPLAFTGANIRLELDVNHASNYGGLFNVAEGACPTIIINGKNLLYNSLSGLFNSGLFKKANVTINCTSTGSTAPQAKSLSYKEGSKMNCLNDIYAIQKTGVVKQWIADGSIVFLRQYSTTGLGSLFYFTDNSVRRYRVESDPKKKAYIHIIYRVTPRVEITEENVDTIKAILSNEFSVFSGAQKIPFEVGQSMVDSENEWREILTMVSSAYFGSAEVYSYGNFTLDIAVCDIIYGDEPLDGGIMIDPSDATKLVDLRTLPNNTCDENNRPSLANVPSLVGKSYFDKTLSKPIMWNGTQYVDGTGVPLSSSLKVMKISQVDYDALSVKDNNTLYVIV